LGISIVYQERSLVDSLSIAENIFPVNLPVTKAGIIDFDLLFKQTRQLLGELDLRDLSPKTLVSRLSTPQKQMVEIAKAIAQQPELLILDEPTASITHKDTEILFGILEKLKEEEKVHKKRMKRLQNRIEQLEEDQRQKQDSLAALSGEEAKLIEQQQQMKTRIGQLSESKESLESEVLRLQEDEREIRSRPKAGRQVALTARQEQLLDEVKFAAIYSGSTSLTPTQPATAPDPSIVCIRFKTRDWVSVENLTVNPSIPDDVEKVWRLASKYLRKNIGLFDEFDRVLTPDTCFKRVTEDGSHTVRLRPNWEVSTEFKPCAPSSGTSSEGEQEQGMKSKRKILQSFSRGQT